MVMFNSYVSHYQRVNGSWAALVYSRSSACPLRCHRSCLPGQESHGSRGSHGSPRATELGASTRNHRDVEWKHKKLQEQLGLHPGSRSYNCWSCDFWYMFKVTYHQRSQACAASMSLVTFFNIDIQDWLVVSIPLKNISQLGWLFPIYGKIKMFKNHQPEEYNCKQSWCLYNDVYREGSLDSIDLIKSKASFAMPDSFYKTGTHPIRNDQSYVGLFRWPTESMGFSYPFAGALYSHTELRGLT